MEAKAEGRGLGYQGEWLPQAAERRGPEVGHLRPPSVLESADFLRTELSCK